MLQKQLPFVENIIRSISGDRLQYLVFIALSFVVLSFTGILYFSNKLVFKRFIGPINPLIAVLLVIVLGFVLLSYILSQRWFAIYQKENYAGLAVSAGLAALFGIVIIILDRKIVFSADLNIPFPESLLFYPVIGYFAEIIFHVLPLTLLLVILRSILKLASFELIVWISILIVASSDPIFQIVNMASENRYPFWAVLVVGIHVYLINFFQLLVYRKYDFVSMYFFRIVYYAIWHVGWGYLRLQLLF